VCIYIYVYIYIYIYDISCLRVNISYINPSEPRVYCTHHHVQH